MKNKILNLINNLFGVIAKYRREIFIFLLSIVFTFAVSYFQTFFLYLTIIVFSLLFLILWFRAGVLVFKSFIKISVGLTLIFYISELFCRSEGYLSKEYSGDHLKIIVGFGIIYSIYLFAISVWSALFGEFGDEPRKQINTEVETGEIPLLKEVNNGKHSLLLLLMYFTCLMIFIYNLYMVVVPIIESICVYK